MPTDKIPLPEYSETIVRNLASFAKSFPRSFEAAQSLNSLVWDLYAKDLAPNPDDDCDPIVHHMIFGIVTGIEHALVMSAVGLDEHAMTALRRSIEFTCYISKIRRSDKRAKLWINRRNDANTAKQFSFEFGVPQAYLSPDYDHLRVLLVAYDHLSDFAIHANLAMLAQKHKELDDSLVPRVFDETRDIPLQVAMTVYLGSIVIQSLMTTLKTMFLNYDDFLKKFAALESLIIQMKEETLQHEHKFGIEPEIIQQLQSNPSLIDTKFQELKNRAKRK
jgi:hypothetical protein